MEGGELFNKIRDRKTPFTEFEVAKIMKQIIQTVKHLHSLGIAHRDLKPENLLLATRSDKNFCVKLCDFGFAKEAHKGLMTPNYTPYYVAPEILRFEKYDISCDIWSLGVIMYILCCGYPPFYSTRGNNISPGMEARIKNGIFSFSSKEWVSISKEAKDLIRGMLETVPEKRYSIDDILNSSWISNYNQLPKKDLPAFINIKKTDDWNHCLEDLGIVLNEMRVDYEQEVKIKQPNETNNPLFKRRQAKMFNTDNILNKLPKDSPKTTPKNTPKLNLKMATPSLKLKKSISDPPGKSSPITALYYSSNLKRDET